MYVCLLENEARTNIYLTNFERFKEIDRQSACFLENKKNRCTRSETCACLTGKKGPDNYFPGFAESKQAGTWLNLKQCWHLVNQVSISYHYCSCSSRKFSRQLCGRSERDHILKTVPNGFMTTWPKPGSSERRLSWNSLYRNPPASASAPCS